MNSVPRKTVSPKKDMTAGAVLGHLLRLSVPMTWGILMVVSFQLVDTFYVSLLGTRALAALSFTFPVTFMIFSFIMGFSIAMSSVVSRLIGEGRQEDVRRITTHGLMLVMTVTVCVSLILLAFIRPLFRVMGAGEEMLPLILDYMHIWFAGAVFLALPMVGNAAIRAGGDALVPAVIMTVVAVVNILLDPVLIFGLFGFPRLELQGAALATVISNILALLAGLYVLGIRYKMLCARSVLAFKTMGDSVRRLLFIALPAGLTGTIQPLVNALIIALLARNGAEAVAAYGIVSRLEAFAFVILMGLAVGMGPVIGQNWGAEKYGRVNETLRLAMRFTAGWSVLIAVLFGLFARPIAGLFSEDTAVIDYAALFFWIVPFSYAFSNLVNGWSSAFNAMGMPHRSFLMTVTKMLVMMIPGIYIGNALGGVSGIFIAMAAVNVIAGTAFHIWSWKTCLAHEKGAASPSS